MNLPLDLDIFDLVLERILLDGAECGAVAERLRAVSARESGEEASDAGLRIPLPQLQGMPSGDRRPGAAGCLVPSLPQHLSHAGPAAQVAE